MKKLAYHLLITVVILCLALVSGCGKQPAAQSETPPPEPVPERSSQDIIEEMVVYYGKYGEAASQKTDELLVELHRIDPKTAAKWEKIMTLWSDVNSDLPLNYDGLPDGLDDSDALCLVALGFQLNPDGSMKDELVERLKVVQKSAEKYPNALIVCTGGGTASKNPEATEAGKMAEWLIENGVDPKRVIVENRSLTTAQNAMETCRILTEQYPQVNQLAILSSDYHIATGTLLFGAESVLLDDDSGDAPFSIVSNAAWKAPSGSLSGMFQAGALIELSGDEKTAFEIYYETYDIHELPAPSSQP
ncbi:MAG: YdcF family protein [Candidatus Limivicinus sp.]